MAQIKQDANSQEQSISVNQIDRIQMEVKTTMKWTLLICLTLYSMISNATFENGMDKYQQGDFEAAYFIFKNLAEIGNKSAQFNLGVMHYRGEFVSQSSIDAYAWMKTAAEFGDRTYNKTAEQILSSLSEKGQSAAMERHSEIEAEYGAEILASVLAPKPLSDEDCVQPPERLSVVAAKYPSKAQQNGMSGFVDIDYNVSRQGYARDVSVRQQTDKLFAKPSAKSLQLSRWNSSQGDHTGALQGRGLSVRYKFMIDGYEAIIVEKLTKDAKKIQEQANNNDLKAQYRYAKHLEAMRAFDLVDQKIEYQTTNQWYLQAAQNGHPLAQYELGKNMVAGRGCEVDAVSGIKWLQAAATSGHPFAQEEIAMSAIYDGLSVSKQATYWLRRAAASAYFKPKLVLAWHLIDNPDASELEIQEALTLIDAKPVVYYDEVRILETQAAVSAAAGDFKKAVKLQKKALKKAKSYGWEIPVMQKRLENFRAGKRWYGRYHI